MPFNAGVTTDIVAATTACDLTIGPADTEAIVAVLDTQAFTGVTAKAWINYSGASTDWVPCACYKISDRSQIAGGTTITLSNSTPVAYVIPCEGAAAVRFKATGWSTGTCSVKVSSGNMGTGPIAPFGAAGTIPLSGFTLLDGAFLYFGTSNDIGMEWDGTDFLVSQLTADSNIKWGVSGAGINHIFYGDDAGRDMTWDQTYDQLLFADNAKLAIGSGAGALGDITFSWNATKMLVGQLTTNSAIDWGVDGDGIDMTFYGDTASSQMLWDQSADTLIFGGIAKVQGLRVVTGGATAITTTRAVTKADSGGVFTAAQSAAYTITVATPAGAGERYQFQLVAPGANDISIVATGCTFEGTITIDAATIPATGSTLKFASGAAILGDNIELISTSTTKFLVRAIGSGAGGITIS